MLTLEVLDLRRQVPDLLDPPLQLLLQLGDATIRLHEAILGVAPVPLDVLPLLGAGTAVVELVFHLLLLREVLAQDPKLTAEQRKILEREIRTGERSLGANLAVYPEAGNPFVFIGAESFAAYRAAHPTVIGMVRFSSGLVQANVDGNLAPDLEIKLNGAMHLSSGDFLL